MIRNEPEFKQATERLEAERARLAEHAEQWAREGFSKEEIARLRAPLESFHRQLEEEVEHYINLKQGQFEAFENLAQLGQVLIGLRIFIGMTQKELAEKLGVDQSMVSRDERNEYHGITVERARRVLDALGVRVISRVEFTPPKSPPQLDPGPANVA